MKEEGKGNWREWVGEFLKSKIGIICKIIDCQIRRNVIIVTLENDSIKREVMLNKSKLKGEQIFIENDLTWEERQIQGRIARWAKEQREKGKEIKIERGKVKIQDKWKYWEDLEKEIEREKETGRVTT